VLIFSLAGVPIGLNAGDEDPANFKLTRSVNEMRITFHRADEIVTGRIMADGNDTPFDL